MPMRQWQEIQEVLYESKLNLRFQKTIKKKRVESIRFHPFFQLVEMQSVGQGFFDCGGDFFAFRAFAWLKTGDDFAVLADQELGKVPADVA